MSAFNYHFSSRLVTKTKGGNNISKKVLRWRDTSHDKIHMTKKMAKYNVRK